MGQISVNSIPPFFQTAVATGAIKKPEFSFYLAEDASGSELTLGGSDPDKYTGEFTYTPGTVPGYWQFAMESLTIGGKSFATNIKAIADTGTSLLTAPTSVISELVKLI